ncbi:MAG: NAD(P)/FAD-dependent oxidoreductase [Kouleothrix sp.]|nr:NAD(P)/FAD-dependent oxidoreductase [Kouleothrix sp.]
MQTAQPVAEKLHEPLADPPRDRAAAPRPARRPRVVIVGCGFGGLSAARKLAGADLDVLLIDRNNYHGFWPLLYQVATAGLEPEAIAYPARAIVRKYPNVAFLMAEARGVDFARRLVQTDGPQIPYDYLVLAAGSANNYFGNQALAEQTFGMKDIDDAERLRNHVLRAFEQAVREPDPQRRSELMTMAIVGGGPTGVELAGAFIELIRHVLRKDYPSLDTRQARVLLIEGSPQLLASFPPRLQRRARQRLERMGVQILLGKTVAAVEQRQVTLKDGDTLAAGTVVWAAGVRAATLADALGAPQARGARVKVTPELHLPDRPEVFVIGDMAYLEGFHGDQPYPMVAPTAIQMGEQAVQNIVRARRGEPLRPFHYVDKGQMATIGRRAAVMDAFGVQLSGRLAWLGWLLVHLIQLVGFRNRLIVLANWAYNYVTYDRGVRLITRQDC